MVPGIFRLPVEMCPCSKAFSDLLRSCQGRAIQEAFHEGQIQEVDDAVLFRFWEDLRDEGIRKG